MPINGTINSETIPATAGNDEINFSQGGSDTINALGGDDTLIGGANFNAGDNINGSSGYDRLDLTGNYAAGVTFNGTTLKNVEEIRLGAGFSYSLTTHDNTIAAGQTLKIDAYNMSAGQSLTVDGSAETNGGFLFYDGQSSDTFIGGSQSDNFSFAYVANDIGIGNGGNDVFNLEGTLNASDSMDGGQGDDVLYLRGNYWSGLTLDSAFVTSFETVGASGDFSYNLSSNDNFVAAGEKAYITGWSISGSGKLWFNGSAETDGVFDFQDSLNNDYIVGGKLDDRFFASLGGTELFAGGEGNDEFHMHDTLDANDGVFGGAGSDYLVLEGDYSGGLTMKALTMTEIEDMSFIGSHVYNITTHNGSVAAGQTLTLHGGYLDAGGFINFDGSAELDGKFEFYGSEFGDRFVGGAQKDYMTGYQGGDDEFHGGGENDSADFGDDFTTADFFDGGAGQDYAYIATDTSAGITLGSSTFVSVEAITFAGGFNHHVTTLDSLVAAGERMRVDSYWLPADKTFHFDGSAETDGSFELSGGFGNDTLIGSQGKDTFSLNNTGNDLFTGNGGDDFFSLGEFFTAQDRIHGGVGTDTVQFYGDHSNLVTFANSTMVNIEKLDFFYGYDYNLKLADGNLAAGKSLLVDAHFLEAGDTVRFDGSAEIDGSFVMTMGDGDDVLRGGALGDEIDAAGGNDTITGGGGGDEMTGGMGADRFDFNAVSEIGTAAGARDVISDFEQGVDKIDLEGIDALTTVAGLQHFTWLGTEAHNGSGATLRYVHSGGNTLIYGDVDANGTGDFALQLNGEFDLTAADFTNASIKSITGTAGNDVLGGAPGGKVMYGLDGDDTITGGGGMDTIYGGAGVDQIAGGLGADQFLWNAPTHTGVNAGTRDIVTDFQQGLDKIDLSGIDANTTVAGNQDFTFLGTAAHTGAGATLRYQQSGGNTIVFADIDANGGADFAIQLTGLFTLSAADFVL